MEFSHKPPEDRPNTDTISMSPLSRRSRYVKCAANKTSDSQPARANSASATSRDERTTLLGPLAMPHPLGCRGTARESERERERE